MSQSQTQSPHHNGAIYQKQLDHFERIVPHVVTPSRSVGELVYSLLPLEDSGLHLVDGSVLYGDGPYGAFVDYVQGLYNSGQYDNLFVTEAEWQQSVSDYEVCGKFVVDTTEDTVRLPKVTGFMEATVNLDAVGELVEAGLPNITGNTGAATWFFNGIAQSGAIFGGPEVAGNSSGVSGNWGGRPIQFDASLSNAIYKNNFNKVQPQSIKGFLYMVVANRVRNPTHLDITQAVRGAAVPVGTIIMSANTTVPQGYLLCDGSAVGRGTYPELFTAIGTTYGDGDGSTTFNLPDLIGKFVEGGSVAGVEHEAGLPNIEGDSALSTASNASYQPTGAIYSKSGTGVGWGGGSSSGYRFAIDASRSNSIYGNSNTVQPPSVTALPCIKAFSSVVSDGTVVIGSLASEVQAKNGEWAGHNAMPSGQYIDLTLPASGGTVTAPADGWMLLNATANNNSTGVVKLYKPNLIGYMGYSTASQGIFTSLPVSKGDIVYVAYSAVTSVSLVFLYANGSAPTV